MQSHYTAKQYKCIGIAYFIHTSELIDVAFIFPDTKLKG